MKKSNVFAALVVLGSIQSVHAETTHLKRIVTGGAAMTNGQQPVRLILSSQLPPQLKKLPEHLVNPSFGLISLGASESPTTFVLISDDTGGPLPVLQLQPISGGTVIVKASDWRGVPYKGAEGRTFTRHEAAVTLQVSYGKSLLPVTLVLFLFDPADSDRKLLHGSIMYFTDTAMEGEITLGSKKYRAMLKDMLCRADFHGRWKDPFCGVALMIDINENGSFDHRGEIFDVSKPFKINGINYEIATLSPDGESIEVVPSKKNADEILPPPDLRVGHKVPSFIAQTIDGKTVHFPEDYKGKKVLLQFWASWCADCQHEMPNLAANYAKFHPLGLEALGISVDKPDSLDLMKEYMQSVKMTWPQIYEGKYWKSSIVLQYDCGSIPGALLVDGTTGEVLANSDDVLAARLAPTLQKYVR